MGEPVYRMANFLDKCRRKRNIADYDAAGLVTENEVKEMIKTAKLLAKRVEEWIVKNYPVFSK
jgi:uncharacterized protein (UPF0332 family)